VGVAGLFFCVLGGFVGRFFFFWGCGPLPAVAGDPFSFDTLLTLFSFTQFPPKPFLRERFLYKSFSPFPLFRRRLPFCRYGVLLLQWRNIRNPPFQSRKRSSSSLLGFSRLFLRVTPLLQFEYDRFLTGQILPPPLHPTFFSINSPDPVTLAVLLTLPTLRRIA